MTQPSLFESAETIRSPLCIYTKHCGSRAELGPPIVSQSGQSINREIRCLVCQRTGVQSTRTDL